MNKENLKKVLDLLYQAYQENKYNRPNIYWLERVIVIQLNSKLHETRINSKVKRVNNDTFFIITIEIKNKQKTEYELVIEYIPSLNYFLTYNL